jgi:hypothetical protein
MNTPTLVAALLLSCAASAASDAVVPSRFEPDCKDIVFQPEDSPVSGPVTLRSEEWITDCVPSGSTEENCWERPGFSQALMVRLTLMERGPLLPWESDVFRVCLTGSALTTQPLSTAYDYRVVRDGEFDGCVVLASGPKRALPPDPRGVQAALTPGLTLAFRDRWASYYPGELIVLKIALKKEVSFWPDENVVEKELTLPVAETYTVEFGGAASGPGIYYARYSIQRLGGRVSTEAETPALQTDKISFEPE